MNILFVVPYVPNLVRVRPYNLIRHLSERGHAVTVATIWTSERERESLEQLKACSDRVMDIRLPSWRSLWSCLKALPSNLPLQSVYSWDLSLARYIREAAYGRDGGRGCDVVHVEHLRGARYGLFLKSKAAGLKNGQKSPPPVVWDSVDSISLLFRQAMVRSQSWFSRGITRFELGRTERYEGWLLTQFERVLVTSPADRGELLRLADGGEAHPDVEVLRNGVDLPYFTPDERIPREPASLVLSGKMSYHANVAMALHLVHDIMPIVWGSRPDVKVYIVGKDPPKEILDLAENPKIIVTGTVGDLRPYLQKATLAVAPISYGAGIQNKVLEAMACATPVVASPQAVSALTAEPGVDLLVAGEPAEFARAVLRLLEDSQLRLQIAQNGRHYVEDFHDWRAVAAQLEQVYRQVLK